MNAVDGSSRMSPAPLRGRTAVVTGAGSGIGRALAGALSGAGVRVVANDLNATALEESNSQLGMHLVPGDCATETGVAHLIARAHEALDGPIDMYFANAGIETGADHSDASYQRSWEVNVMAHVRAVRLLLPGWLERGEGWFVPTVSAAGMLTMLGSAAYSTTKHAALAHAEWIAATYGHRGVTVQAICPSGVATPMLPSHAARGKVVLADGVIEPEAVADCVVDSLGSGEFLILPHPEVRQYYELRATDTDRWLRGMQGLQRRIDVLEQGGAHAG